VPKAPLARLEPLDKNEDEAQAAEDAAIDHAFDGSDEDAGAPGSDADEVVAPEA
jgi:hypothetical protein